MTTLSIQQTITYISGVFMGPEKDILKTHIIS